VCRYAECHYAECHYAECHYAKFRGAITALKSFTAPAPAVVILFANSGDKKFPTVRSAADVIKLFTTVIYELNNLAIAFTTGKLYVILE
jgi:hypothetical protein